METVQTRGPTVIHRRILFQGRTGQVLLIILGFSIPILVYVWYLQHYGLNVVYGDQWDTVSLIGLSYKGKLTLSALWAQHNENRIFFPNLIALALSRVTAFNVVIEQCIGAGCLFGAVALIIGAHKRRCTDRIWLAYCPIVILMLSVVQGDNILSGFQMAWYLVLVTLAGVIFILDREWISPSNFLASIALAIVGSFSSVQGLLIWVAGLMLLYYRDRSRRQVAAWIGAAAVTAAVYFYNFNLHTGVPGLTAPHLPSEAVRFFFQMIGDILGSSLSSNNGLAAYLVFGLGCLVVALAVYSLWSFGRRRDTESAAPVGLVLIAFGLLCALSTTYGRAFAGAPAAAAPRYTTFDLLIVVGTYLTYIAFPRGLVTPRRVPKKGITRTVVLALLGGLIVLQAPFGFVNGLRWARWYHQQLVFTALYTVDINRFSNVALGDLEPLTNPNTFREGAKILSDHHLTFFADQQTYEYYKEIAAIGWQNGVFHRLAVSHSHPSVVVVPTTGSVVVSGKTDFFARVRNVRNPRSVEFELTGIRSKQILPASPYADGWFAEWHSSTVSNGDYHVWTIVIGPTGQVTQGRSVSVMVRN